MRSAGPRATPGGCPRGDRNCALHSALVRVWAPGPACARPSSRSRSRSAPGPPRRSPGCGARPRRWGRPEVPRWATSQWTRAVRRSWPGSRPAVPYGRRFGPRGASSLRPRRSPRTAPARPPSPSTAVVERWSRGPGTARWGWRNTFRARRASPRCPTRWPTCRAIRTWPSSARGGRSWSGPAPTERSTRCPTTPAAARWRCPTCPPARATPRLASEPRTDWRSPLGSPPRPRRTSSRPVSGPRCVRPAEHSALPRTWRRARSPTRTRRCSCGSARSWRWPRSRCRKARARTSSSTT